MQSQKQMTFTFSRLGREVEVLSGNIFPQNIELFSSIQKAFTYIETTYVNQSKLPIRSYRAKYSIE